MVNTGGVSDVRGVSYHHPDQKASIDGRRERSWAAGDEHYLLVIDCQCHISIDLSRRTWSDDLILDCSNAQPYVSGEVLAGREVNHREWGGVWEGETGRHRQRDRERQRQ